MSINLDDPDLTAYALGELSHAKRAAIELAIANSPEAQAHVSEVQELAGLLKREFRAELNHAGKKPASILPLPQQRSFWSDSRWGSVAVAALLAIAAVVAAVVLSDRPDDREGRVAKKDRVLQMEVLNLPPAATEPGGTAGAGRSDRDDGFVAAVAKPVSAFALNVGTTSYGQVRRAIESGSLPSKDSVQIEEMINYFSYDYPEPDGDQRFAITTDAVTCPWQPKHLLVRVAVKARNDPAGALIARNARVEVEFNAAQVKEYRLIGYDAHLPLGDTADGEEITAGHAVDALYEVVPLDAPDGAFQTSDSMWAVKLSFMSPEGGAFQQLAASGEVRDFAIAPADLKFIAAVAEFGMILRGQLPGRAGFESVLVHAEQGRGDDRAGDRATFVELVRKAQTLSGSSG